MSKPNKSMCKYCSATSCNTCKIFYNLPDYKIKDDFENRDFRNRGWHDKIIHPWYPLEK